ncbi:MAG: flagellar hook-length control protein FliK [Clostridiales bacterium]|jgi:hypothetical protein|nr:flagellar hook-length control protein FliK [Clostridiales bacterium]
MIQAGKTEAASVRQQILPQALEQLTKLPKPPPPSHGLASAAVTGDLKAELEELLKSLGLQAGKENLELLEALLDNGFPLDKETVSKMRQYALLSKDPGKAVFFLKNGETMTQKSLGRLNAALDGAGGLVVDFEGLSEAVEGLPPGDLKSQMEKLLNAAMGDADAQVSEKAALPRAVAGRGSVNETHEAGAQELGSDSQEAELLKPTGTPAQAAGQKADAEIANANSNSKANAGLEKESGAAPGEVEADGFKEVEASIKTAQEPDLEEKLVDVNKKAIAQAKALGKDQIEPEEKGLFEVAEMGAKDGREAGKAMPLGAKAKRFAIKSLGKSPQVLERFLEETVRFLQEAKEIASGSPEGEKVREALDKLLSRFEFLAEAKSAVLVQVPALLNGQAMPLELYVFREKSGKKLKKATSALLALDSARLGRIEAYVQKADSSVRVSFRLETGEAAKIAQKGQEKLARLLSEAGLSLSGVTFCQMEKPFGLLSREEELSGEKGCQPCTLEARA